MKRLNLIFVLCMVGLVFAYPVWAAEESGVTAYDWSGFYLGAHGGYSWVDSSWKSYNTVTNALVQSESSSTDHPYGGIQIGNDFMLTRNILIGLEFGASYHGSSTDRTTSNTAGTNISASHSQTDWSESLEAKFGYVFRNWLFFGHGGVIFNQGSAKRTQVVGTTGLATPGTVETLSINNTGWTAGAGVEYGFAPGWSAYLSYRYSAFSYTNSYPVAQRSSNIDTSSNSIVIGVNYKFNWGSPLIKSN